MYFSQPGEPGENKCLLWLTQWEEHQGKDWLFTWGGDHINLHHNDCCLIIKLDKVNCNILMNIRTGVSLQLWVVASLFGLESLSAGSDSKSFHLCQKKHNKLRLIMANLLIWYRCINIKHHSSAFLRSSRFSSTSLGTSSITLQERRWGEQQIQFDGEKTFLISLSIKTDINNLKMHLRF